MPSHSMTSHCLPVTWVFFLTIAFAGLNALGEEVPPIDAAYPGGNIAVDRIEGDTVFLRPDPRDTEGWWFYWNFRVRGAAGRTLTFRFLDRDPIGARGPAMSADGGESWAWLGADAARDGQFTYAFPPDTGDYRFAFTIPYQESNLQHFLAAYRDAPLLRMETLCKTKKGRDVELLRAGRLDGNARFRVLIAARHHACEAMGSYVLEGMLDAVLAHDGDGPWFQEHVELVAIPFMDKDGVEDGDQGKNRRPHDHNRDYGGTSLYPETAALRALAESWPVKSLAAFDLHCPYLRGKGNEDIYLAGSPNEATWNQQQRFCALLETTPIPGALPYQARHNLPYGQSWNNAANFTAGVNYSRWAEDLDGIRLSVNFEIPYATAGGAAVLPDPARAFGHSLIAALRRYLQEDAGQAAP